MSDSTTAPTETTLTASPARAAQPKEPETFSREYVQELRRENEQWRHKARGHETDAGKAREAAEAAARARDDAIAQAKRDAETAIAEAGNRASARIILAELRAAAVAAGMVDVDGLKLLDTEQVRLNDANDVVIPDGFFDAARKAKPYLFAAPPAAAATTATTSSAAAVPATAPSKRKTALEMSDDELRAFEKAHGISR